KYELNEANRIASTRFNHNIEEKPSPVLPKDVINLITVGSFSEIHHPLKTSVPDDTERSRIEEEKDKVRILDVCNHIFHETCVDTWLTERSTMCPNCRLDTRIALGIIAKTGNENQPDDDSLISHIVNFSETLDGSNLESTMINHPQNENTETSYFD
ncbi:hypothetical protein HK096_010777, partial [Nowakowskiella sp. JEL0078]